MTETRTAEEAILSREALTGWSCAEASIPRLSVCVLFSDSAVVLRVLPIEILYLQCLQKSQQQLRILPIGLLFSHSPVSDLGCISEVQFASRRWNHRAGRPSAFRQSTLEALRDATGAFAKHQNHAPADASSDGRTS